ncbi:unnamed protein product [Caenorhabditis nigoni]
MSLQEMEELDAYPESGDLLDANMIPTAATEVVMSGDGIERTFVEADEEGYQYEYTYEEEADDSHHHHHMEEEVVVTEETDYPAHWKQDKKMNLYDVLDGKLYMEESKQEKRPTIDEQAFAVVYGHGATVPRESSADFSYPSDEFREFPVYAAPKNVQGDRTCQGCGMTLRRSVFYHHARMIREKGACNLYTPQRFPCTQCDARIGTLEKLCQHMEQIHQAPTQIKTMTFTNEEDFKQFRIELEGKGGNFRMARGNKKSKKGVVQYFRCNRLQTLSRNQTFRPVDNPTTEDLPSNRKRGRLHQQELRAQSAKQVIRTENSCTAFYNKAYLDNGIIEVRFCDHHLHDDEKLRLPEAVRMRVIELARKNLPHVVILMIVKDERFKYCERNSANDRRIQDMKTQDIRQVLAGNNRSEKTRLSRGEAPLFDPNMTITSTGEEDPNRPWPDIRSQGKIDRCALSLQELRYLDLFDSNREEIMAKLNERTRVEQDKKALFDSFIHRLSSSQEIMKHLHYRQLIPSESTLMKLKKAYTFLNKIEDQLLNPRREQTIPNRVSSYMKMMEEEAKNIERGRQGGPIDEIDVVGIDEEEYSEHLNLHDVVAEEEVGYIHHEDEEGDMELQRAIGAVEDDEYPMVEEVIEHTIDDVVGEEVVEEGVVEETVGEVDQAMEEQEVQEGGGEEEEEVEEDGEPTVTRTGRVVKKKPHFDA